MLVEQNAFSFIALQGMLNYYGLNVDHAINFDLILTPSGMLHALKYKFPGSVLSLWKYRSSLGSDSVVSVITVDSGTENEWSSNHLSVFENSDGTDQIGICR